MGWSRKTLPIFATTVLSLIVFAVTIYVARNSMAAGECDNSIFDNYYKFNTNHTVATTKNKITFQSADNIAKAANGHLVVIPTRAANDTLKSIFSSRILSSTVPNNIAGAWIGMNDPNHVASYCLEGTSCIPFAMRFQWMNGSASSFTNWAAGNPNNFCFTSDAANGGCKGEDYAFIDNAGLWRDDGPHTVYSTSGTTFDEPARIAIVEWDSLLSCISTPPGDTIPPTTYVGDNLVCFQPKPDGSVDNTGVFMCGLYDNNYLCPVDRVDCTLGGSGAAVIPECPGGGVMDNILGRCVLVPTVTCRAGYGYDNLTDVCSKAAHCPGTGTLRIATNLCEIMITDNDCPTGYAFDIVNNTCSAPPVCDSPGIYDALLKLCVADASVSCDNGFSLSSGKCVAKPACPTSGYYNSDNNWCQAPYVTRCFPGYVYDNLNNKCIGDPVCPDGGTFNPSLSQCVSTDNASCTTGYSMDNVTGKCLSAPRCPAGGAYNITLNRCETSQTFLCPTPYAYSSSLGLCLLAPTCPTGGSFHSGNRRCQAPAASVCPTGYTFSATFGRCTKTPDCPTGTFNPALNICEAGISITCPDATLYDNTLKKCIAVPACPDNVSSLNLTNMLCETPIKTNLCPAGYTYESGTCTEPAICPDNTTLNVTTHVCEMRVIGVCPDNTIFNATTGRCESDPTCPPGTALDLATKKCFVDPMLVCGGAFILDNATKICYSLPSCPDNGAIDYTLDKCLGIASYSCAPGYTYNTSLGRCQRDPDCPLGSLFDPDRKSCTALGVPECPADYSYDNATALCLKSPPDCPTGGTFVPSVHFCLATGTMQCPSGYTYEGSSDKCVNAVVCLGIGSYSSLSKLCEIPVEMSCPLGYVYDNTAGLCGAIPTCPDNGTYVIRDRACELPSNSTCPPYYNFNLKSGFCEKNTPDCPPGGAFNVLTSRCEKIGIPSCPVGFSLDNTLGKCVVEPSCLPGGTYIKAKDRCEAGVGSGCDNGFLYNASLAMCQAQPVCPPPGVFDSNNEVCKTGTNPSCPLGYSFNVNVLKCQKKIDCPGGGKYNPLLNACEVAGSNTCALGYLFDEKSKSCVRNPPDCPPGSAYNQILNRCERPADQNCPDSRFRYASGKNTCIATVNCPNSYDNVLDNCVYKLPPRCPDGYVYDSLTAYCKGPLPVCPEQTTYNTYSNRCEVAPKYACPPGTFDEAYSCSYTATCPSGSIYSYSSGYCVLNMATTACPTGYINDNGTCVRYLNTCIPGETFVYGDYNDNPTWQPPGCQKPATSLNCPVPYITNPYYTGYCYTEMQCPSPGIWVNGNGRCEAPSIPRCSTGATYNSVTGKCEASKTCPPAGTYDRINGRCEAPPATATCEAGYTFDPSKANCYAPPQCAPTSLPKDLFFTCLPPSSMSASGNYGAGCYTDNTQTPPGTCPPGYSLQGPFVEIGYYCQGTPGCSGTGVYGGPTASCTCESSYTATSCPLGYLIQGGRCIDPGTCPSGYTFNSSTNVCETSLTDVTCPSGFYKSGLVCYSSPNCPVPNPNPGYGYSGFWFPEGIRSVCYTYPSPTCDNSDYFAVGGSTCQRNLPVCGPGTIKTNLYCPSGTIQKPNNPYLCLTPYTNPCPPGTSAVYTDGQMWCYTPVISACLIPMSGGCPGGFTLNTSTNLCEGDQTIGPPQCPPGGKYNVPGNICLADPIKSCSPPYTLDYSTGNSACSTAPVNDPATCVAPYDFITDPSFSYYGYWYCQASPISVICGPGYSWDNTSCSGGGVANIPTCPDGGTYTGNLCPKGMVYSLARKRCESTPGRYCPDPYVDSPADNLCVAVPSCPPSTMFDSTRRMCVALATANCPAGTYWNMGADGKYACIAPFQCSSIGAGVVWDSAREQCVSDPTTTCPAGMIWSVNSCVSTPACPPGTTFDSRLLKCIDRGEVICTAGTSWDGQSCTASPICPTGTTYDKVKALCVGVTSATCPDNTTWNGLICSGTPLCPADTVFNIGTEICESLVVQQCPPGMTWDGFNCTSSPHCTAGTIFDVSAGICVGDNTYVCPDNTIWNGFRCEAAPICPPGEMFSSNRGRCERGVVATCPPGSSWDGSYCVATPICAPGSSLNYLTLTCEAPADNVSCLPGTVWIAGSKICSSSPDCPSGATWNSSNLVCAGPILITCPTGTIWNGTICTIASVCPSGTSFMPASLRCETLPPPPCPGTYDVVLHRCSAPLDNAYNCPPSFVYDAAEGMCYALPFCPTGTIWDNMAQTCAATPSCPPLTTISLSGTCDSSAISQNCFSGGTWDAGRSICKSDGVCPPGTSFSSGYCIAEPLGAICPGTTTWDPAGKICAAIPTCVTGTSLDNVVRNCTASAETVACPSGNLDGALNLCYTPFACTDGTVYNSTSKRCESGYLGTSCPPTSVWNNLTMRCEVSSSCPTFSSYLSLGMCTDNAIGATCPPMSVWNVVRGLCEAVSGCAPGASYSSISRRCEGIPGSVSCTEGTTWRNPPGVCAVDSSCPPATTLDIPAGECKASYISASCPVPFTSWSITDNVCETDASCPSGAVVRSSNSMCNGSPNSLSCPGSMTWNSSTGNCTTSPGCIYGTIWDTAKQQCTTVPTGISCPAGTGYDNALSLCTKDPCSLSGIYRAERSRCEIPYPPFLCPPASSYSSTDDLCLSVSNGQCTKPDIVQCPYMYSIDNTGKCVAAATIPPPNCPSGGVFNSTTGKCMSVANITCDPGMTYNSSTYQCESIAQRSDCHQLPSYYSWACTTVSARRGGCDPVIVPSVSFSSYSFNPSSGYCESNPSPFIAPRNIWAVGGQYPTTSSPFPYTNTTALAPCPASYQQQVGWGSSSSTIYFIAYFSHSYYDTNTMSCVATCSSVYNSPGVPVQTNCGNLSTCPYSWNPTTKTCRTTVGLSVPYCLDPSATPAGPVVNSSLYDSTRGVCRFFGDVYCPPGSTYISSKGICSKTADVVCSTGYIWDPATGACSGVPTYPPVVCPGVGAYDSFLNSCVTQVNHTCPSGYSYDNVAAVCATAGTEVAPTCLYPGNWNATAKKCIASANGSTCPISTNGGSWFDSTVGKCLTSKYTPPARCLDNDATLNTYYGRCTKTVSNICPPSFNFDNGAYYYSFLNPKNCVSAPTPGTPECLYSSTYNVSTGKCELSTGTCPSGFSNSNGLCQAYPECKYGFDNQITRNGIKCYLGFSPFPICPFGLSYSKPTVDYVGAIGSCFAGPTCPPGGSPVGIYPGNACGAYPGYGNCSVYGYPGSAYKDNVLYCTYPPSCSYPAAAYVPGSNGECYAPGTPSCPSGYSPNGYICVAFPACPSGGTLTGGQCVITGITSCPSGYHISGNTCVMDNPTCLGGGALNPYNANCESGYTLVCPTGYVDDHAVCRAVYTCPDNSTLNHVRKICEVPPLLGCPIGYTADNTGICVSTSLCPPQGTKDPLLKICWTPPQQNCPVGYTLDNSSFICVAPYSCPAGGNYNSTRMLCEAAIPPPCAAPYMFTGTICIAGAICPEHGSLNMTTARCEAASNRVCAAEYTMALDNSVCTADPRCDAGGTFNPPTDRCEAPANISCPSGYAPSGGNTCTAIPLCPPGGALETISNRCLANPSQNCPPGLVYDTASTLCLADPTCAIGGMWDFANGKCLSDASAMCTAAYTYDAAAGRCIASPICSMGSYSAANDRCELLPTKICTPPTVLGATGQCEMTAVCALGVLDMATGKCMSNAGLTCPSSFAISDDATTCFTNPACDNGGLFDNTSNKCVAVAAMPCLPGYAQNPTAGTCYIPPVCPPGSALNVAEKKCLAEATIFCPGGMSADLATGICRAPALCISGTLDTVNNLCVIDASSSCEPAYTLTDNVCVAPVVCVSPGAYDNSISMCSTGTRFACPGGYSYTNGSCVSPAACSSGGSLDVGIDQCVLPIIHTCPGAYSYNSVARRCETSPRCATGIFFRSRNQCVADIIYGCPSGLSYVASIDLCIGFPTCPVGGTLNNATDNCEASIRYKCPDNSYYTYNDNVGKCMMEATCPDGGELDKTLGKCVIDAGMICDLAHPGYAWDNLTRMCQAPPLCDGFDGSIFDNTLHLCVLESNKTCSDNNYLLSDCKPEGHLALTRKRCEASMPCSTDYVPDAGAGVCYSTAKSGLCEAEPKCLAGAYDPVTRTCGGVDNTMLCPSDVSAPCINTGGGRLQCSKNSCVSDNNVEEIPENPLQDNVISNDNCTKFRVFGGTGYSCRSWEASIFGALTFPASAGTAVAACPLYCQYKIQKEMLSSMVTAASKASSSSMDIQRDLLRRDASSAVSRFSTSSIALAKNYTETYFSAAKEELQLPRCVAQCMSNAINEILNIRCCSDKSSFFGLLPCQESEKQLQDRLASAPGTCHYIGEYCSRRIRIARIVRICVQRKKTYCCFNSKFGKIVQEAAKGCGVDSSCRQIGAGQLTTPPQNYNWGSPEGANCKGLKPEDITRLDFSRVNFGEIIPDMAPDSETDVNNAVQSMATDFFARPGNQKPTGP